MSNSNPMPAQQGSTKDPKATLPNSHFMNPVPEQLRELVLDYLFHNCYTKTANAFAKDCAVRHLDADGDEVLVAAPETTGVSNESLDSIEARKEIQLRLLSGRIEDATSLLNDRFPSVLFQSTGTTSEPSKPPDTVQILYTRSLEPAHLSLNLRIQAFIEAVRTIPLIYKSTSALPPSQPEPDVDPDAHKIQLICLARKLNALVRALEKQSDRDRYEEELNNVVGLLAYPVPEKSPVAKYLSQERREAVAEQINSAILYRTGHLALSKVELYTRYNAVLWSFLHDLKVKRSETSRAPNVSLPEAKSTTTKDKSSSSKQSSAEAELNEAVPAFNLRRFLDTK